jgi:flagellin-specific chaperone FliS
MLTANQFLDQKQKRTSKHDPYLVQKIMSARPEQLISYVYDAGIKACSLKDSAKAIRAIQVLIKALNYEAKEVAVNFYNIYRYINYSISQGNFAEAKRNLEELKSTWTQAMKVV